MMAKMNVLFFSLIFPLLSKGETSFIENNLALQANKTKIEAIRYDSIINRSLFLPELSISTGLGSEYKKNINETDKGPYLYLSGKINIFRGNKDFTQGKIIQSNLLDLKNENELLQRKIQKETFKFLLGLIKSKAEIGYLEQEIKDNEKQLKMAQKKVDAGLTTAADLLDFQLKTEALQNDIRSNQFKISDIEKELHQLLGNQFSIDTLMKKFDYSETNLKNITNVKNQLEWQMLENRLNSSKLEVHNARADYLPTIDVEGKYGNITPNHGLFVNKTERQIALNVTIPLFSGFSTDAKTSKALLESAQIEKELRQKEIELSDSIEQDIKKIELNTKIITSMKKSHEKASKYKELIIYEYKKGIKNSSDVINASDKLLELTKKMNDLKQENNFLIYSFNNTYN